MTKLKSLVLGIGTACSLAFASNAIADDEVVVADDAMVTDTEVADSVAIGTVTPAISTITWQKESPESILNTFTLGVKGGWTYAFEDDSSTMSEGDHNAFGGGIYGEWNVTPHFGLGIGYNIFTGVSMEDSASRDCDLFMHGPEFYGKGVINITNDWDAFARVGVAYIMTEGEHGASDSTQFAPVVGIGAEYALDENWKVRAGLDWYHDVYEHADIDLTNLYVSANYTF